MHYKNRTRFYKAEILPRVPELYEKKESLNLVEFLAKVRTAYVALMSQVSHDPDQILNTVRIPGETLNSVAFPAMNLLKLEGNKPSDPPKFFLYEEVNCDVGGNGQIFKVFEVEVVTTPELVFRILPRVFDEKTHKKPFFLKTQDIIPLTPNEIRVRENECLRTDNRYFILKSKDVNKGVESHDAMLMEQEPGANIKDAKVDITTNCTFLGLLEIILQEIIKTQRLNSDIHVRTKDKKPNNIVPGLLSRDLKPENFVFDPTSRNIALIDFGSADLTPDLFALPLGRFALGFTKKEDKPNKRAFAGTASYAAPETYYENSKKYFCEFSSMSEIYSLGLNILGLLSRADPTKHKLAALEGKPTTDASPEQLSNASQAQYNFENVAEFLKGLEDFPKPEVFGIDLVPIIISFIDNYQQHNPLYRPSFNELIDFFATLSQLCVFPAKPTDPGELESFNRYLAKLILLSLSGYFKNLNIIFEDFDLNNLSPILCEEIIAFYKSYLENPSVQNFIKIINTFIANIKNFLPKRILIAKPFNFYLLKDDDQSKKDFEATKDAIESCNANAEKKVELLGRVSEALKTKFEDIDPQTPYTRLQVLAITNDIVLLQKYGIPLDDPIFSQMLVLDDKTRAAVRNELLIAKARKIAPTDLGWVISEAIPIGIVAAIIILLNVETLSAYVKTIIPTNLKDEADTTTKTNISKAIKALSEANLLDPELIKLVINNENARKTILVLDALFPYELRCDQNLRKIILTKDAHFFTRLASVPVPYDPDKFTIFNLQFFISEHLLLNFVRDNNALLNESAQNALAGLDSCVIDSENFRKNMSILKSFAERQLKIYLFYKSFFANTEFVTNLDINGALNQLLRFDYDTPGYNNAKLILENKANQIKQYSFFKERLFNSVFKDNLEIQARLEQLLHTEYDSKEYNEAKQILEAFLDFKKYLSRYRDFFEANRSFMTPEEESAFDKTNLPDLTAETIRDIMDSLNGFLQKKSVRLDKFNQVLNLLLDANLMSPFDIRNVDRFMRSESELETFIPHDKYIYDLIIELNAHGLLNSSNFALLITKQNSEQSKILARAILLCKGDTAFDKKTLKKVLSALKDPSIYAAIYALHDRANNIFTKQILEFVMKSSLNARAVLAIFSKTHENASLLQNIHAQNLLTAMATGSTYPGTTNRIDINIMTNAILILSKLNLLDADSLEKLLTDQDFAKELNEKNPLLVWMLKISSSAEKLNSFVTKLTNTFERKILPSLLRILVKYESHYKTTTADTGQAAAESSSYNKVKTKLSTAVFTESLKTQTGETVDNDQSNAFKTAFLTTNQIQLPQIGNLFDTVGLEFRPMLQAAHQVLVDEENERIERSEAFAANGIHR